MKNTPSFASIFYLYLFFMTCSLLSACNQKDEPLIEPKFEIAEQDIQQGFLKAASTTLVVVNTNLTGNEWTVSSPVNWCKVSQSISNSEETKISISVDANTGEKARETKVTLQSSIKSYVLLIRQQGTKPSIDDVQLIHDIKIKPTLAEASDYQPGYEIAKTFDGIIGENEKFYHSKFGKPASFPVTLEYFFSGHEDIDYLIYYTRSGNGNFGEVDIYTATEQEPKYKSYGSFDFRKQNASSRIEFSGGLKNVYKIKFLVKNGLGDFASCDEMEFYKKKQQDDQHSLLLNVFTDITCSALKPEVSEKQIALLPGYFADLALKLRNNSYNAWEKEFRIRDYSPYSNIEEWSEKLMTKQYSDLDNPTGIYAQKNDSLIVLVGDTHGHSITLQSVTDNNISGSFYFLKEGINKIGIKNTGMLYVMYTSKPGEQPIRIHIPPGNGTVNGFFDLKEHKTDAKYAELLQKATYKYFCIRGEKIMFYFHREQLLQDMPSQIVSAINLWDDIVGWQHELMGIDDIRPSQVNNHMFAVSTEDGYMSASAYQIHFIKSYLINILSKEKVMSQKDNAWGPAHEIGHINQRAINWPSCSESSNNLFSNFILYKLGKYCSRGSALKALADSRFTNNSTHRAWYALGNSEDAQAKEDAEIHMRMNWQLWNYYHRCGYKPHFWQTLFKLLREEGNRIVESNPGAGQLKFAQMACKAANENLTEFFEMWGFFEPVDNVAYEQYGHWNYHVSPAMIQSTKQYMAQFPAPKHAFYYLEDRKAGDTGLDITAPNTGYYTQFKNNTKITKSPTATLSGQTIDIKNGEEAVAFEIRKGIDGKGELLYFSNTFRFIVPSSISVSGISLFAVQADGTRQLITKFS